MSAVAPVWQHADYCFACKSSFGLLTRRHHCRKCGSSVCDPCTARVKEKVQGYNEAQLVCKQCVAKGSSRAIQAAAPTDSQSTYAALPVAPAAFPVAPAPFVQPQEAPSPVLAAPSTFPGKDIWMCRKCYFNNVASTVTCSVCSTHRPLPPPLAAVCGNCNFSMTGSSGARARCPSCSCIVVFPSVADPVFSLIQPPQVVSPFNGALWECEACTFVSGATSSRCEMCNASPPRAGVWDCFQCTFENAWERETCEMCRTSRPSLQICFISRQSKLQMPPKALTQEEKDLQFALSESEKEFKEQEARILRSNEELEARLKEASEQSEKRRLERARVEFELKESNRVREEREREEKEQDEKEREERERLKQERGMGEFKQPVPELDSGELAAQLATAKAQQEAEKLEEEDRARQERQEEERVEREKREEEERLARLKRKAEEEADAENERRAQADLQRSMEELAALREEQQRRLRELAAKSERESNDMLSQWRNEAGVQKPEPESVAEVVRVHVPEDEKPVQTEQQERRQVLETLYNHIGESKEALRAFMSQSSQFKKGELSAEHYADVICSAFPEESLRDVIPLLLKELSTKNRDMALNLRAALRTKLGK